MKFDNRQMIETITCLAKNSTLDTYDLSFLENPEYGKWRIEKDTCQFIGKFCEMFRPGRVLEFGSGLSTLILAHEAAKGNVDEIWSIDHLADFPGHPKDILISKGQSEFVHLCHFSIRPTYCGGKVFLFYSIPRTFLEKIGPLDLVIVDGPPYGYESREAALHAVYPHLSMKSMLLLDDANRTNREQVYVANWRRHFGENIDSVMFTNEFKKGLACVWPTNTHRPVSPLPFFERWRDSWPRLKFILLAIFRRFYRLLFQRGTMKWHR